MKLLKLKQQLKGIFLKYRLHRLVRHFGPGFSTLHHMSLLSDFVESFHNLPQNDFFQKQRDYKKRYNLYYHLLNDIIKDEAIQYLEFGVAKGTSFRWWLEHAQNSASRFYGFDTFTGLPEDWDFFKAGAMTAGGALPEIKDARGEFYKGMFQDTLPGFLHNFSNQNRNVIHMDADLYTSTLYVLTSLAPYLKQGDIIIFDEFAVPDHEFLAFKNFIDAYRVNFDFLGAVNNYYCLAIKIV